VKARLVRIGNSRGVRLPRPLIEEAGLPDEVELHVEDRAIVISPAKRVRAGWAEAAARAHAAGDDEPLLGGVGNRFDDEEWKW
jgi:antitoxin MazE